MGHDILLVLFGGGFTVGVLKFIEFLIQLKTNQKNRKEDKQDNTDKKLEDLKQDIITNYCEKNTEAITHLTNISKEMKNNIVLLTKAYVQNKEYDKHVGAAINGIIHDRIMHNVEGFIERGGITVDEISTLKSMYYPYKKLGGNGDVETAYEKIASGSIPVITKEEALKRDILLQRKRIYGQEKAK